MKITSFRIPEELHTQIKVASAKAGITMQEFIQKAIKLSLHPDNTQIKKFLNISNENNKESDA